ncbi:hypothetical protein MNV_760005 [Candidatus Methanoperedens nitroreducens]|uniref:Uncharacterized protein n=1 Tax=Candidatus Methanoperedens nitratireducens TaxID=1392998 RepID=A0A284VTI5_9EURY|nr:hypothetical protein MNV_760005 [Candidatus Methanoperedens nitroreducens]
MDRCDLLFRLSNKINKIDAKYNKNPIYFVLIAKPRKTPEIIADFISVGLL